MDKSMLAGLESLPEAYQQRMASMMEQVQIRDRAVARRIQNMGWRADGGLWLFVRGGGLYLSKGTGLTEEFEEVPVQSRGFDSSKHNKELKDQASDVGVLLADTDGIFHSIKS
ncbi:hypothetical protein S83_047376 [Arachis hypogaea]